MEERKLERLHPGLPVSDVQGAKIGTVAHVYQEERDLSATAPIVAEGTPAPPGEKVIEVKTGVLGLGKHLFIPAREIETITDDQVILDRSREEVEAEQGSVQLPNLTRLT